MFARAGIEDAMDSGSSSADLSLNSSGRKKLRIRARGNITPPLALMPTDDEEIAVREQESASAFAANELEEQGNVTEPAEPVMEGQEGDAAEAVDNVSPNEEEEEEDVKTHRVLVRNLPVQAPEDLLLTIFHDDPVLEANVTIDEDRNVAMATLHFRELAEAQACVRRHNGQVVEGKKLLLSVINAQKAPLQQPLPPVSRQPAKRPASATAKTAAAAKRPATGAPSASAAAAPAASSGPARKVTMGPAPSSSAASSASSSSSASSASAAKASNAPSSAASGVFRRVQLAQPDSELSATASSSQKPKRVVVKLSGSRLTMGDASDGDGKGVKRKLVVKKAAGERRTVVLEGEADAKAKKKRKVGW